MVCYYDPTTGTFLTRDPFGEPIGTTVHANPYAYSRNDPLNRVATLSDSVPTTVLVRDRRAASSMILEALLGRRTIR